MTLRSLLSPRVRARLVAGVVVTRAVERRASGHGAAPLPTTAIFADRMRGT